MSVPSDFKQFDHWLAIAKNNGLDYATFYTRVKILKWDYKKAATTKNKGRVDYGDAEYALYKGDKFLSFGSLQEISEETGKPIARLKFMRTPSYKKRMENSKNALHLIILDNEEEK